MTAWALNVGTATLLSAVLIAGPASAGMNADLKNCANAASELSADACTRVLNSGRLPGKQRYIGHYNRGWAYRNAGNYDAALADFAKSADYNPSYADTYYSKAIVHLDRNEKEHAAAELDTYLDLQKDKSLAHYMRALMFRRMTNPDQALAELDKAAQIKPAGPKELTVRALALSDKNQHREAQAMLDGVIGGAPTKADAFYARALVRHRSQDLPGAAADADQAIKLQKDFPVAELLAGRIAEDRGDIDGARARYQRVAAMKPKTVDAQSAVNDATKRLTNLSGTVPEQVAARSSSASAGGSGHCNRFVRELGRVMTVACGE